MSDRAKSRMGGGKSHRKPQSMHIKRGKSGGFITTHHHANGESEDHVVRNKRQLLNHISDHMGDQPASGASPEEMPQPAPTDQPMQQPMMPQMGM